MNVPLIIFLEVRIFSSSPKLNFFINKPTVIETAAAGVAIEKSQILIVLKALLSLAITSTLAAYTACVQANKNKESSNILISVLFCKTFTNINLPNSLWIGLFSFIGADSIYKTLEGRISSYEEIIAKKNITIPQENVINEEDK